MAAGLTELPLAKTLFASTPFLEGALPGSTEELTPTQIAQPALFFVETVLASCLPDDLEIVAVAGHSVGEYAACAVGGAFVMETGMKCVVERGKAMAAMHEGTMAAVMGLDPEKLEALCAESGETVVVANFNSPAQIIISGTRAGVTRVCEMATAARAKRAIPIPVSGAFHSPLMQDAAEQFAGTLESAAFTDAKIPVVSNVDGKPHENGGEIRSLLRAQLTSPVRWMDCVASLKSLGAEAIVEVGPGSVLTGLNKRIVDLPCFAINNAESARNIHQQLGALANV